MTGRLSGKTILVTGSTHGIGRGIAEFLAGEGAFVVVSGRSADEGEAVASQIRAQGGEASFIRSDISTAEGARGLIRAVYEARHALDGLVNNAGIFPYNAFLDVTEEDLDNVYRVNIRGSFFCAQEATRIMCEQGGGSIVNIGSTHWQLGGKQLPAYACSKGALHTLTQHIAYHFAREKVRCNWITVGWVVTPGELERIHKQGHDYEWLRTNAENRIPSGSLQTPEDMARACLFFLSDESAQVTGTDMEVTGAFRPV